MKRGTNKREKGAVVIEATLSLSFFMFFVIIFLSVINMCIAQSKIGVALNESAKEFSEFSYIYSLTGVNEPQRANYEKAEGTITDINSAISGLEECKNAFEQIAHITESDDPWTSLESAEDSASNAKDTYVQIYKNFKSNPAGYILGIGRVVGNEGAEWIKGEISGAIVKGLMLKHLKESTNGDVDKYLMKHRVVGGMDGLKLDKSSVFTNGSDDITFICIYKLRIMQLLNVDFTYDICQVARTKAWTGNSLVRTPEEMNHDDPSDGDSSDDPTDGESSDDPSDGDSSDDPSDGGSTDDPTVGDTSDDPSEGESDDEPSEDDEDPYKAMRKKMVDKYGEEVVRDIENQYGDETKTWDEETWSTAAIIYAMEYECPEILDEKEREEYDREYKPKPGGGCFVAGTKVKTPYGDKNIEELVVGDEVYSYNYYNDEDDINNVTKLFVHESYDIVKIDINEESILATNEHPFYVLGEGFKPASDLETDDELVLFDGKTEEPDSISHIHYNNPVKVYNFEVEDWHTYYVSEKGVLVHNSCMAMPDNVDGGNTFKGRYAGEDVLLKDVKVKKQTVTKVTPEENKKMRKEFENGGRKAFLQDLAKNHEKELRDAGFTDADIAKIKGGGVPDGWQVHHKFPIDYGGTNDFSNLVLIKNTPYHSALTTYQRQQGLKVGESKEVLWPYPNGCVYPANGK
ncbi:polymorphic toxin-type HINT domain-containing protein [Butyrivibrio sp. JL13D10]|uniref:polymorphic toxin-type HINT domain-containing protein n=1 Tax=Butyrivibrio sp. JL13D10 TaxID=3236815 RepID=UPI0038B4B62A